jgi:hypothetical protein
MNSNRLTFIHAAGVLVDHQARDIAASGEEELRTALLDAAGSAWQQIIEACVVHDVDFLLLSGDTFCEADRSLRARAAIRTGFECLADAGIQVIAVPGCSDPTPAWQAISGLPENVTLFDPLVDEPTAIMKHGEVLASVQACLDASPETTSSDGWPGESAGQSRIGPFRVGIAPAFSADGLPPSQQHVEQWLSKSSIDYLALPRPFRRIQIVQPDRVAHCPGPAVALTGADFGPMGASLIQVEANNAVSIDLLPVSPVRRERLNIRVDHTSTGELLIGCMRQMMRDLKAIDSVQVLLLEWRIKGDGELYDSLHAPDAEAELFELLNVDTSVDQGRFASHQLTLLPLDELPETGTDDSESDEAVVSPILSGFLERLNREPSLVRSVLSRHSAVASEPATPWFQRLESLASRVDHSSVAEMARVRGTEWFGGESDQGYER